MMVDELVHIAAEHASNWMDIWMLYIVASAGWMSAMIALNRSLSYRYGVLLIATFLFFLVAHWVTICRHYAVFWHVLSMIGEADQDASTLVTRLAPPEIRLVAMLYWLTGSMVAVAGVYRCLWANKEDAASAGSPTAVSPVP